jgi:hypothetical protein
MRTVAVTVVGLVTGLVVGILASALIGIVGLLAFDRLVGVRFLPVMVGVAFAAAAPLVDRLIHRRPTSSDRPTSTGDR